MICQKTFSIALVCLLLGGTPRLLAQDTETVKKRVQEQTRKEVASNLLKAAVKTVNAAETVRDVVEDLTTQQRATQLKAKLNAAMATARAELTVLKIPGEVILEGSDDCWLGDNFVKMRIPISIRYFINLQSLSLGDIQFNAEKKTVRVKLPPVQMEEPSTHPEDREVLESKNPVFRSDKSWYKLRDQLLDEDLKPAARAEGKKEADQARKAARVEVQSFLYKVFAQVDTAIVVIVE